jgi:hypothetical protein
MCDVWCASRSSARALIRSIHRSESAAASRNPRTRSITVSAAVIEFVIVKWGPKAAMA